MATIPSLALLPSGYKASKVYSVLPTDGSGDFTFTRSGNATRVNSEGLIELVSTNVPRLNYPLIDGVVSGCPSLLLEPARTNLVTNSNDFTSWINSGSYITAGYGISPDGSQNASRCLFTNTNQTLSKIIGTNGTLSYSIYVKGVKGETINISMASGSDNSFTLNGEWQRLSYSDTVTNSTLNINTFDGKTARDLLIFGAQFELGSYPTSYIPTQGSVGTRSAETCNNAGDVNTFNDSEGVLFAEISALANDGIDRQISISNGTTAQRIYFGFNANTNEFILSSRDSSYIQVTVSDVLNFNKYAFQYKTGNFKAFINGFNYNLTLDGGLLPTGLDRLNFDSGAGSEDFYGNTKQIQYYDSALNDSDLETLTSWTSFISMANAQQYNII